MFFFFQAEDGIRDLTVTGVQTCALPILINYVGAKAVPIRLREGLDFRLDVDELSRDRKSTRLNSSHSQISYAVFCLKKKKMNSILHGCDHVPHREITQDLCCSKERPHCC